MSVKTCRVILAYLGVSKCHQNATKGRERDAFATEDLLVTVLGAIKSKNAGISTWSPCQQQL